MRKLFIDEYGDLRFAWQMVFGVGGFIIGLSLLILPLALTEAKYTARVYSKVTGVAMTTAEAFWTSPDIIAIPKGTTTVLIGGENDE